MDIFHFYFLNIDISVTIYITELKFSVWILKVLVEGSVSQFLFLGPSYHLMTKKTGNFFSFFCNTIFYIS